MRDVKDLLVLFCFSVGEGFGGNVQLHMFTIHLTPERYEINRLASLRDDGRWSGCLHFAFESEPSVGIGDEVAIVVGDDEHVGIVVNIAPPERKLSPAGKRAREESLREEANRFARDFGIHPDRFPKDPSEESEFREQWYVLVGHKETKRNVRSSKE